jgi:L-ascorbate metabolism protein UlaG (beta-lactamase superfamily)
MTAEIPNPRAGVGHLPLMRILLLPLLAALSALGQTRPQTQTLATPAGELRITPLYHASALIEAGGKTIYIDPAPPARFDGLPKADLILITHLHHDHFDPPTLRMLSTAATTVLAPPSVVALYPAAHPIANGETRRWEGWTIQAIPAYNMKRGPAPGELYHPRSRGDNGYVLTYGGKRIYFSGDTENTPEMRALKNIDLAFICMNLPYTMPPTEAAAAVRAFHPKVVIPYHYKGSDLHLFQQRLAGSGIEVRLLDWYPKP